MPDIDRHGQLKWNTKSQQAYYTVSWPLDIDAENSIFSGKVQGEFSNSPYGNPIQIEACYVPEKSDSTITAADNKIKLTIPQGANGSEAGLYAAITTGYDIPDTDPLPSGQEIHGNQIYYITALQPPSNGSDTGQELKEMPEGAEIQLKALTKGCDLCRLVEYEDEEGEIGQKWKAVKDPDKVRYLGTFALVSNGAK